jgi:homopolymeric O-antigen transport system ATP-binding protein
LEPEILIVDEVLAVGDAQFQRKCLGKIGQVSKDGRTVLFVSHNMAAVRKLCSHAFLLKKGRVHAGGPTNEIISTYLNAGNAEHLASIELPPGPPESPCRATRFQCLAMDGRPQADFRLYEPWRCKVEFEMFESVPNVVVAVGLINHESIPIITYWSQPKDLARGKYQVEFDCRVPLKACTLEFAVGISTYLRPIYYTEGIGHASISTVVASGKDPLIASGGGLLLSAQEAKIQAREC